MPAKNVTRANQIVERIAQEIVAGARAPGAPLDETQIAAEHGVSRTPVREALRELAATGLVEIRPHRGAVVAEPDAGELAGMFLVMAEMEALCASLAAVVMSPAERRALEDLHARMAGLVRAGDLDAYRRANVTFHGLIYDGAHNRYLKEVALATRRRLAPFRRAQFEAADRLARSHLEHDGVVNAILRAEGERAGTAMREHIGLSQRAWERIATGARLEPIP